MACRPRERTAAFSGGLASPRSSLSSSALIMVIRAVFIALMSSPGWTTDTSANSGATRPRPRGIERFEKRMHKASEVDADMSRPAT